ncbi:MAG: M23 family metallopeptidase [Acidimicrobiales bacterium]
MFAIPARRATRRVAIVLTGLVVAGIAVVGPASSPAAAATIKPIAFPVEGKVSYIDTWGAARSGGRTHEGTDLMGQRMQRLLSAVDGTVLRVKFDNLSSGGNSVVIRGADGWTYHYVHVNNDTPGTDDGRATRDQAFPSNIVVGATVRRGQVVAYMGDSGNAEGTGAHLHFEIRQPPAPGTYTGVAINPYPSVRAAELGQTSGWQLRTTTSSGPADLSFSYGLQAGDRALLCDWDGSGIDRPVIFRGGQWHLRTGMPAGGTARQFTYGMQPGDVPLCADVDGDGADEPIIFRSGGQWHVRSGFEVGDRTVHVVRYGLQAGDVPVVGDWDGDERADLAIFRGGRWHIRSSGAPAGRTVAEFGYGAQRGDVPVAGDWDGDGADDAGIYRGGEWHLRSNAIGAGATVSVPEFGLAGEQPVVGHWGQPDGPGIGTFLART